MLRIANILVATDFSDCSVSAVMYGRAMAQRFGARLHVLHTLELMPPDLSGLGGSLSTMPELQSNLDELARAQLNDSITAEDRRLLRAITILKTGDTPAQAISDYARTAQIDLIVIGTHGRRGLSHLVMGSVAEKVVRMAPCPVLTVRHPEREFVVADAPASPSPSPRSPS
jgi:nucleotide-binding universal stress UspA family protein